MTTDGLRLERASCWICSLSVSSARPTNACDALLAWVNEIGASQVFRALYRAKLAPLALRALELTDTGGALHDQLKIASASWAARDKDILEEAAEIIVALRTSGIQWIVLKGLDLLVSVPYIVRPRIMHDVDLLFESRDDALRARDILIKRGYSPGRFDPDLHRLTSAPASRDDGADSYELPPVFRVLRSARLAPFCNEIAEHMPDDSGIARDGAGVTVVVQWDLHWNVLRGFDAARLWSRPRTLDGGFGRGLSWTNVVLFIASRFYLEAVQLHEVNYRLFSDLLSVLLACGEIVDWEELARSAADNAVSAGAFYSLLHASRIVPVPLRALEWLAPNDAAVSRRLDYGDFVPRMLGSWAALPTPMQLNDFGVG